MQSFRATLVWWLRWELSTRKKCGRWDFQGSPGQGKSWWHRSRFPGILIKYKTEQRIQAVVGDLGHPEAGHSWEPPKAVSGIVSVRDSQQLSIRTSDSGVHTEQRASGCYSCMMAGGVPVRLLIGSQSGELCASSGFSSNSMWWEGDITTINSMQKLYPYYKNNTNKNTEIYFTLILQSFNMQSTYICF